MAQPDGATASGHFADLRVRLVSAAVITLVAGALIWLGGWPFYALIGAVTVLMLFELWGICFASPAKAERGLIFVVGAAYVLAAAAAVIALRSLPELGLSSLIWAALVVVAADVGGYFAGRMIGGPKLWPRVSPKKTWAGLGGGVALAFFVGGLFSWATTGTYFYQVCVVSMVAAVVAQGGDLAESALKRHFGVKDAGSLIPGHGGVLDRLDGHMAAVLVAALVTFWRGQPVFVW